MENKKKILVNCVMTPDGNILISNHVHDYKEHITVDNYKRDSNKELKNDTRYTMVDGGTSYLRRGGVFTDMTIYEDDPFEVIRRFLCRGGRGKNGDKPLTYVPLFRMSNSWLEACIEYTPKNYYNKFYKMELDYRKENNIFIKD